MDGLPEVRSAGAWPMDDGGGSVARDASGRGNDLTLRGGAAWGDFRGVGLNGTDAYLETARPVVDTEASYSVAAWVRLDAAALRDGLTMQPEEYAWTALSQDSPTHSPFYLGIRRHEAVDGSRAIYWNITMAPVDGSVTGTLEWRHAFGAAVTEAMIGQWVLLVGVSDVAMRQVRLLVPGVTSGISQAPDEWPYWPAPGGLQVGRARWLGNPVDWWPGSIGPVYCFDRVLSAADADALAAATAMR